MVNQVSTSLDVLDLYDGKEVILARMGFLCREKLKSFLMTPGADIQLSDNYDIPQKTLYELVGGRKMDINTFRKLEGPLGITWEHILPKPYFETYELKEDWEKKTLTSTRENLESELLLQAIHRIIWLDDTF